MMELLLLFTTFGAVSSTRFPNEDWGYAETKNEVLGPEDWYKRWEDCGHQRQSPINIETNQAVKKSYSPLRMTFDNVGGLVTGKLENTGHSPKLTIADFSGAKLTGGPLRNKTFQLLQFHVHFGCAHNRGSEHTLDEKKFSGQLHLVFDGPAQQLAVVALWIKVPSNGNKIFGNFANLMKNINEIGTTYSVDKKDGIYLMDLIPKNCPNNQRNGNGGNTGNNDNNNDNNNSNGDSKSLTLDCYYTYEGSLTTPHCDETVHWMIVKGFLLASDAQLNKFRKLKAEHGREPGLMCDNYRPVQPLNDRIVYSVTSQN